MQKSLEARDVISVTSSKKLNRCRSFHFRYLELCRAKNLTPLQDIRAKNNATSVLDLYGDKLSVNDWLLIMEALCYDQVLQTLALKMRKSLGAVLDQLDTEKKAKLFKQKPVIFTKFIFSGLVEAISNCIEFNKNLRVLSLEGLPLTDKYIESVAKALSSNDNIKEISFQRSNIQDKGCEAICNTIKYLVNIEKLNLSECGLTVKGAEYVADMIKIQKISRYTEGWQQSLRYREFDPDSIPGLRSISLSRNQIGDDGLKAIMEILKEDVWVKFVNMENCGLTDRGANMILDCLAMNNYIIDFNIRSNPAISKFLMRSIREHLGKDDDDQKVLDGQKEHVNGVNGVGDLNKKSKITVAQLKEQLKTLEEQLAFERLLRKKAEQLNEKLNQQIIAYENRLEEEANVGIPEGYVVVKNESLQSIIRERNDFQKIASSMRPPNDSPRHIQPKRGIPISTQHSRIQIKAAMCPPPTTPVPTPTPTTPVIVSSPPQFKEQRKGIKVRKVKSEMKYIDPAPKDPSKKKESKSDHEFSNEHDFHLSKIHFETNIGDTVENTLNMQSFTPIQVEKSSYPNKLEIEDLCLSSSRSTTSNGSSESDTLRNSMDYQPLKVFIRRAKQAPQQQYSQGEPSINNSSPRSLFLGGGEGTVPGLKSPRSLFLGLCDD